MSLYRQYRPHSFADVSGQQHAITTLQNAVEQDKLAHAYLFAGSRGTGKTSVARILAKAMLTKGMTDDTLKRQVMEAVDDGSLVDLVEIDAASNRGIDDIRLLVEKIQFSPVVAAAKVYIIDEVHMLTREAFNALLKTLEEPPPYAYFILATTELQKIPLTIQSRCQRFTFRQIKEEDIVARLRFIADKETIKIDDAALHSIAVHAQGGLRDAISLLDQLRSLPQITSTDVRERIGESGQEHVQSLFQALDAADAHSIVAIVAQLEQAGIPLDVFVRQLLAAARTRLHQEVEKNADTTATSTLLNTLLSTLRDLRIAPVPGLVLESSLLSAIRAPAAQPVAQPPKAPAPRIEKAAAPTPPAPAPSTPPPAPAAAKTPAPTAIKAEPAPESAEPGDVSVESVRQLWPKVVLAIPTASVKMSLKNASVQAVRGKTIVLSFASVFHRDKVSQTDAARQVEEVIAAVLKHPLKIDCIVEEERRTTAPQKEELVNLAEAASEIF